MGMTLSAVSCRLSAVSFQLSGFRFSVSGFWFSEKNVAASFSLRYQALGVEKSAG
jgi:hypothetical protein